MISWNVYKNVVSLHMPILFHNKQLKMAYQTNKSSKINKTKNTWWWIKKTFIINKWWRDMKMTNKLDKIHKDCHQEDWKRRRRWRNRVRNIICFQWCRSRCHEWENMQVKNICKYLLSSSMKMLNKAMISMYERILPLREEVLLILLQGAIRKLLHLPSIHITKQCRKLLPECHHLMSICNTLTN